METALYLRQSQALGDDTLAVDRQRVACERLAAERGLTVVQTYVDNDTSATKGRRQAYERMVLDYQAGAFGAICVLDLDRLTRKPRELEDWVDRAEHDGLRLYTASGDADLTTDNGRLFARIKAAVARAEVERKGARQRLANDQAAAQGRGYWRRRPTGYLLDGSLVEDEAGAIRDAYQAIIAGESLASVQRMFNERGVWTPQYTNVGGSPFSLSALRQLLASPRNAAILVRHGEEMPGAWEPIVQETTYRQALHVLRTRAAGRPHGSGKPETLLSGWARCEKCSAVVRSTRRSKATGGARVYRCTASPHLGRSGEDCDAIVIEYITAYLSRPDVVEVLSQDRSPNASSLTSERDALRTRLDALVHDHHVLGLMPRHTFLDAQKALSARLDALEGQMTSVNVGGILGPLAGTVDVRATWDGLSLERQRAALKVLVDVTILGGRGTPVQIEPLGK